tara:strand:- start:182 stop:283 length:102 start_codon:yes stop_codon:yes gene_type:complete
MILLQALEKFFVKRILVKQITKVTGSGDITVRD